MDVRRGSGSTPDAGDNQVRPATYSDNYVTLWPGQSQTISESYRSTELQGRDPVVSVGGFNVDTVNISGNSDCSAQSGVQSFGHADGNVSPGNASPGKANTRKTMAELKERVKVRK